MVMPSSLSFNPCWVSIIMSDSVICVSVSGLFFQFFEIVPWHSEEKLVNVLFFSVSSLWISLVSFALSSVFFSSSVYMVNPFAKSVSDVSCTIC